MTMYYACKHQVFHSNSYIYLLSYNDVRCVVNVKYCVFDAH